MISGTAKFENGGRRSEMRETIIITYV